MINGIYKTTIPGETAPDYRGTSIMKDGRYWYTNNYGEVAQGTYRLDGTSFSSLGYQWRLHTFSEPDQGDWREMKFWTAVEAKGSWNSETKALTLTAYFAHSNETVSVTAKKIADL